MVVIVMIGRRTPKSWFRKGIHKARNVLSFQEHLWTIIKQSLGTAKKRANSSNTGIIYTITNEKESEDLNYEIQWIKCVVKGNPEQEQEEYEEALRLYNPLGKMFKKEMPVDDNLKQHFKTKLLSPTQVKNAYEKGYGAMSDNNIVNKLLEMGILTHIEKIDDK